MADVERIGSRGFTSDQSFDALIFVFQGTNIGLVFGVLGTQAADLARDDASQIIRGETEPLKCQTREDQRQPQDCNANVMPDRFTQFFSFGDLFYFCHSFPPGKKVA